jgi:hypothetical protein
MSKGCRENEKMPWVYQPFKVERVTIRGKSIPVTRIHEAEHALADFMARPNWGWQQPVFEIHMGNAQPIVVFLIALT